MREIGGVPIEEIATSYGGVTLRFLKAAGLEGFVDGQQLLGGGEVSEPPYWMHLWPAARVLASIVAARVRQGSETRVIELGCGLGLPSLVALKLGARAVASDWKREPLHFVRASAELNGCRLPALQMDWARPALRGRFDLCLGADVAYDAAAEPSLVAALRALLRRGGSAWLADSVNTYRTTLLERLRQEGFEVAVSEIRTSEEGRPVWVRLLEARRIA